MTIRLRGLLSGALAAVLAVGCSDSTAPKSNFGLRIAAGANVTDTIGAILTQALVVQVHESNGGLARGTVVRFTALPNDSLPWASAIAVADLNSQYFSGFVSDSTDTDGHAAVLVELGSVAGKSGIVITVPELGLTDTAFYTVKPGRPAQLGLGVHDTVVTPGAAWDIGVHVTDRVGNSLTADSVTYASINSGATVTAAGRATAVSQGRAGIAVQFGTAHDTSWASVVPPGVMVAVRPGTAVYVMNLDGTGLRTLTGTGDYSVFPQWSPDRQRITLYEGNPYGDVRFSAVSLDGTRTPIVPTPGSLLGGLAWARPDMNGLLYFSGPHAGSGIMTVWRMNADGSGLVALWTPTDGYDFTHPAPSPDGKTVLYDVDPLGIMALDVATGTVHALGLQGVFPVYSPDGAHIAYVNGPALMTANSDGTNAHVLWGSSGTDGVTSPSWSADGKWILAAQPGQGAALVRVSDGVVLPLHFSASYSEFALR